jgi:hypothetical protein
VLLFRVSLLNVNCPYAECHAILECYFSVFLLAVLVPNVIILIVIVLNLIFLIVFELRVVAPGIATSQI